MQGPKDDSNRRIQNVKSVVAATTALLWENANGASEDEEDESKEEGEAKQALVDGVVVVVLPLRKFADLDEPVDEGYDSTDVQDAEADLGIDMIDRIE